MAQSKLIFKYEPLTLRAIQNLKSSSVYFGSPANFNDPYDCALTATIGETPKDELENIRVEMLANNVFTQKQIDEIQGFTLEQFEAVIRRGSELALKQEQERFLTTKGVTCFSKTNDNLLLWSHYGGKYKGFCLGFCTDFEPFNKLEEVRYTNKMPMFRLNDFICNGYRSRMKDLFCTKSKAWAYEKEYRAFHAEAGALFHYRREALKGIYFGPDIDIQDRDLLCLIAYCQFPDAELWIGRRSSIKFAVEFEKISDYLPYAEAQRRGLA
jgi:hypothetical protein